VLTGPDDERVTRLGRFLSRTKLDEIPQLWDVLTGSMSLVGPRPQDPSFVALRQTDYARILQVKPGITGLYQLAFARENEVLDGRDHVGDYVRRLLPQKTQLDRLYVAHRSILMDLRILGWTAMAVLFRSEVAVHRSTGRLTLRRRPLRLVPEPLQAGAVGDVIAVPMRRAGGNGKWIGPFTLQLADPPESGWIDTEEERSTVTLDGKEVSPSGNGKAAERVTDMALRGATSSRTNGRSKPGTRAVVLAGGRGTRLIPHTSVLPKPLVPIGDRPILEVLIKQLASCGIVDVTLCVGHLSHLIEAVIGASASHEVSISYVREDEALGTAAPLRLIEGLDGTFIG
jgi:hypothetical protein